VTARQPELVRLDLPARYTYLHLLSDCIAEMLRLVEGVHDFETLCYNIQLAAHEICTNIINHAYDGDGAGRLEIALRLEFPATPRLTIDLYDSGRPFDPDSYSAPDLDEVRIHGYGLFLVHHLMDTVNYTPARGRNHWCLTKSLFVEGM
jgi:serine/threonine-protein kinase RsbW